MKVAFCGPSIFGLDLGAYGAIDIRPPARCGDIEKAQKEGATHIGLIDGTFENGMSVWHREIAMCLVEGIKVSGSSSMGALRAAECASIGMKGVGEIYRQYERGLRVRDADVAILHGPVEVRYVPLTLALVDFDATLDGMLTKRLINPRLAAKLQGAANAIHFKRRTLPEIFHTAHASENESLLTAIQNNWINLKCMDAALHLEFLANSH